MQKMVVVFVGVLFISTLASAQVIANFSAKGDLGGFTTQSGNNGLDSLYQTTDPSDSSNGVLGMYFNFASGGYANAQQHGIIGRSNISTNGAQLITYWVYLPGNENIPDSLRIDLFAQDNKNYTWVEDIHYAVDIPKDKWYPLSFALTQHYIQNPAFDIADGELNLAGIQIFPTDSAWSGAIYVDNVTLVGTTVDTVENFSESGTAYPNQGSIGRYYINTQYASASNIDSIYTTNATDSSGLTMRCLAVATSDTGQSGGQWIGWNNIGESSVSGASRYLFLSMWMYIPKTDTIPSGMDLQLIYQPHATYYFNAIGGLETSVPQGHWYPVYYPIAALSVSDSANDYLSGTNDLWNFGIQVYENGTKPATPWHGTFYIADVQLVGYSAAPPPPVWLAADFRSKGRLNGLNGFKIPSFATTGSIGAYTDLVNGGVYTLKGTMSLSMATPLFATVRDSVPMMDPKSDKASGLSMNVLLPSGMPMHGVVKVFVTGGRNDSGATAYTIGSQIKTGSWTQVTVSNLDSLASVGKFNPADSAEIGIEVYYPSPYDTTMWSGSIEIDSVKVYGESFPTMLPDEVNAITGIETAGNSMPRDYRLYNNYPNPFNPSTVIQYDLPRASMVVLKVYDVLGRQVATLSSGRESAGSYKVSFNGDRFASGVYFVRMFARSLSGAAETYTRVRKMLLLK